MNQIVETYKNLDKVDQKKLLHLFLQNNESISFDSNDLNMFRKKKKAKTKQSSPSNAMSRAELLKPAGKPKNSVTQIEEEKEEQP